MPENLGHDLDAIDIPQTDQTVVRVCKKVWGGVELIDVRKWRRNKKDKTLYPGRQGVCLNREAWVRVIGALEGLGIYLSNNLLDVQS